MQVICKTESHLALLFLPPTPRFRIGALFYEEVSVLLRCMRLGSDNIEVGVRRYGGGRRGKQKFEVWKFKDHNRKAHVS